jgi:hypothetical protein
MPEKSRIVAVGLLSKQDLNLLGQAFPLDGDDPFADLLMAIDVADEKHRDGFTHANA